MVDLHAQKQAEEIQQKIRDVLISNVDQIAAAMIEKARDGHINSTQLLFELSGLASAGNKNESAASEAPKMFLLSLLDDLFNGTESSESELGHV